ncbi:MAG TPA: hypothetical protein VJV05_01145 [Pyrinomonadaceae bacterium]|nr:hypothetical protein [Pyrinomonadaceae bacterium]
MKAKLTFIFCVAMFSACGLGPDMNQDRIPRSPTPTPWQGEKPFEDNMRDAAAAYAAKDYPAAAKAYGVALDQEKAKPKLEKKQWRELVNNTANAYTLSGDTKNARLALAYGVSKDFDYPMFHYILARTFGAEGSEPDAIGHLERAFERRSKLSAGEKLPDPMTDESFASFTDSDTFKRAVSRMKAGPSSPLD